MGFTPSFSLWVIEMEFTKDELFEIEKVLDVQAGHITDALSRLCNLAINYDALHDIKKNPLDKHIMAMQESYDTLKKIRDKLREHRLKED